MDYKRLIDELSRFSEYIPLYMRDDDDSSDIALRAADAIETLLKERNAAIADLRDIRKTIKCCVKDFSEICSILEYASEWHEAKGD